MVLPPNDHNDQGNHGYRLNLFLIITKRERHLRYPILQSLIDTVRVTERQESSLIETVCPASLIENMENYKLIETLLIEKRATISDRSNR